MDTMDMEDKPLPEVPTKKSGSGVGAVIGIIIIIVLLILGGIYYVTQGVSGGGYDTSTPY